MRKATKMMKMELEKAWHSTTGLGRIDKETIMRQTQQASRMASQSRGSTIISLSNCKI